MQFFVFDLTLAVVALLAYRALATVMRHRAPVILPRSRMTAHRPALLQAAPLKPAQVKPLPLEPVAPERLPPRDLPRATLHRLINFW